MSATPVFPGHAQAHSAEHAQGEDRRRAGAKRRAPASWGIQTVMALRIAGACGYLAQEEAQAAIGGLDSIIAVLWTLAHRR